MPGEAFDDAEIVLREQARKGADRPRILADEDAGVLLFDPGDDSFRGLFRCAPGYAVEEVSSLLLPLAWGVFPKFGITCNIREYAARMHARNVQVGSGIFVSQALGETAYGEFGCTISALLLRSYEAEHARDVNDVRLGLRE